MGHRIGFIFGTRPEAIKLSPLIKGIKTGRYPLHALTIFTGQHREIARKVLSSLAITPDYSLATMAKNQQPADVMIRILKKLNNLFKREPLDMVVVQGDTTTAMTGALAAFYKKIPVAHVEAGLRTGDKHAPYPEEINRSLIALLADYHFAPTPIAKRNLLKAGARRDRIFVTGNTVIDALQEVMKESKMLKLPILRKLNSKQKIILVTVHRRESFGEPLIRVCKAIKEIVQRSAFVEVILPVHPNPNVKKVVHREIGTLKRVHLIAPTNYLSFLHLLQKSNLVLTDSGGIVEEAPSFRIPVLILRDKTERPESIQAGLAFLVGTNPDKIVKKALWLLNSKGAQSNRSNTKNPFGDGKAAERILTILSAIMTDKPVSRKMFQPYQ